MSHLLMTITPKRFFCAIGLRGRTLGVAALAGLCAAPAQAPGQTPEQTSASVSVPSATPDTTGLARSVERAREALLDLGPLWKIDGREVEWIFTDGQTHLATQRRAGRDSLVPIFLPASTTIANTAVDVDGRRWAMVVLPLSGSDESRARLLIHEAIHTFQPEQLPRPGNTEAGEGGDLLDGEAGRTWLFLELRALAAAITSSGDARRSAARDALLFRARRDSLAAPAERTRLDNLDVVEGIPEYTAWRLSGSSADSLAAALRRTDEMPISWVRAVSYWTGPAYGFLLDQLAGNAWRDAQRQGARLPTILATVLGSTPFTTQLDARARLYGGDAIRRAERARVIRRTQVLDSLRTRFVSGPVLRLIPGALQVSFDPNGQTPLATDGTVMMNFRWAGKDSAELVAPLGALVSPTWSYVQVPLGTVELAAGTLEQPRIIEGDGWRLTLPAGWRVTRVGRRVELRPPE